MSTSPTGQQLRVLQTYGLTTRLVKGPRKGKDEGYGWGRTCSTEDCSQRLHHLNPLTTCESCQLREKRAAA